jgi:hypothetical protein
MNCEADCDEQALLLREQGRPFVEIAQVLTLPNARSANASFNRALRLRSRADQERLRSREMARLDDLAVRLRRREDLSMEEIVRRMRAVKDQRRTLFVG